MDLNEFLRSLGAMGQPEPPKLPDGAPRLPEEETEPCGLLEPFDKLRILKWDAEAQDADMLRQVGHDPNSVAMFRRLFEWLPRCREYFRIAPVEGSMIPPVPTELALMMGGLHPSNRENLQVKILSMFIPQHQGWWEMNNGLCLWAIYVVARRRGTLPTRLNLVEIGEEGNELLHKVHDAAMLTGDVTALKWMAMLG